MTSHAPKKCPACGNDSTGKFCNSCGSALDAAACAKCGAKTSGRGKFCPECGASTLAGAAVSSSDRTPWIIAGVAVAALVIVLAVVVSRGNAPAAAPEAAAASGMPDLTQMTPRDAADRLFDHVARATSANDTAQVAQFAPMALQAYAMLGGNLDPDARLHIGLIHIAMRNRAALLAEADTVLRGSSTHLFGLYLRMQASELPGGDAAAGRRAAQAFLQAYDTERAKSLPEYGMHEQLLTEARTDAQRLAGAAAR